MYFLCVSIKLNMGTKTRVRREMSFKTLNLKKIIKMKYGVVAENVVDRPHTLLAEDAEQLSLF